MSTSPVWQIQYRSTGFTTCPFASTDSHCSPRPRRACDSVKECNQCGKCCTLYGNGGLSAGSDEIEYWETNRPDIASYVSAEKIWISPVTGKQMVRCPWLRKLPNQNKYFCRIYYDRPNDCRYYPVDIDQMIKDECEMLEPRDLINPKKAQKTLDTLMSDCRPPAGRD